MKASELIEILSKNPDFDVKVVDCAEGLCEIDEINTKDDYYPETSFGNDMPKGNYFIIETA